MGKGLPAVANQVMRRTVMRRTEAEGTERVTGSSTADSWRYPLMSQRGEEARSERPRGLHQRQARRPGRGRSTGRPRDFPGETFQAQQSR
jgi:hypothetical protein